jgi:hypothetical protein
MPEARGEFRNEALSLRCERQADLVGLGKVVGEHLLHPALLLRLLLQGIQVLQEQVTDRVGRFEF